MSVTTAYRNIPLPQLTTEIRRRTGAPSPLSYGAIATRVRNGELVDLVERSPTGRYSVPEARFDALCAALGLPVTTAQSTDAQ